ncbi:hypothetical protein GBAR_LOCUS13751, partial [Geodia barretti]
MCYNKQWTTIHADGWSFIETKVACGQMNFSAEGATFSKTGRGAIEAVKFTQFSCSDSNKRLIDCSHPMYKSDGRHNVLEVNVVTITCTPIEQTQDSTDSTMSTQTSPDPTMSAALSIGIICVVLLIGIIVAYFVIQFIRKRKQNSERYASIPYY